MVYTDMVATSKLYVRESSAVPIYALLLFGGETMVTLHDASNDVDSQQVLYAETPSYLRLAALH